MMTQINNNFYSNAMIEDKAQQYVKLGVWELFGVRFDTFLEHSDLIMDNIGAIAQYALGVIGKNDNNKEVVSNIQLHWESINAFAGDPVVPSDPLTEEIMKGEKLPHFLRKQAD